MPRTNTADLAPATYTYEWSDAEQSGLIRTDAEGNVAFVPADPGNRDYAEFLSSGATAEAYVAPPEPAPLTAEQKLEQSGLTVTELKELLGL
jgi:hypothetical protein